MSDNRDIVEVPFASPRGENELLSAELSETISKVIRGGVYIGGPEVTAFEGRLASYVNAHASIGVASGTDALALALLAAGVGPGMEVIAPSFTAGPTVAAINMVGAVPVLVEVEEATFCIDPEAVEAAISDKTRAIIAVHLYGHPAALGDLRTLARSHDLALIEDCAQAIGSRHNSGLVGSVGDFGCFSFYPTKNLGAIGDGGAISVPNGDALNRVRALRVYGWQKPQFSELPNGRCSRLDELQAAILNVKFKHLESWTETRRAAAERYRAGLHDLPIVLPNELPGCRHVYHLYVIRTDRREALQQHLGSCGVRTALHYPYPVHQQPGLAHSARFISSLERTERLTGEILSLPMFSTMSTEQVDRVIDAVRSFFGRD